MDDKLLKELLVLGARAQDDALYEIALAEIEADNFDRVAKAKAFEESEGNAQKARSLYLKHRIRRIRDQIIAFEVETKLKEASEAKLAKSKLAQLKKHKTKSTITSIGSSITGLVVKVLYFVAFLMLYMVFLFMLVPLGIVLASELFGPGEFVTLTLATSYVLSAIGALSMLRLFYTRKRRKK